jgi:predicted adenylyl cyclase CyaB
MPKNLEIKARIQDITFTKNICERLNCTYVGQLKQTDTYFRVSQGRLKLREIENEHAELIRYDRQENSEQRTSDFEIYKCENGLALKKLLSDSLGVRAVVEKLRTLFLHEDTRIHLDEVMRLGMFLEFEVPVGSSSEKARETMNFLIQKFGIEKKDYYLNSYVDLLENETIVGS